MPIESPLCDSHISECKAIIEQVKNAKSVSLTIGKVRPQGGGYPPMPRREATLKAQLKELGERYSGYGYLMQHALLKSETLVTNRKRTYRVYSELRMQVRTKGRKKLVRPRVPMAVPTRLKS